MDLLIKRMICALDRSMQTLPFVGEGKNPFFFPVMDWLKLMFMSRELLGLAA